MWTGSMSNTSNLPSQQRTHPLDDAYERGFIFGREAIIKRVRDGVNSGYCVTDILELLDELSNVKFTRL